MSVAYEGDVIDIKNDNLICVQFKDDFVETFDHTAYMIDVDFTRGTWIRMHYAIDLAFDIFGIDYLNPTHFVRREKSWLEIDLNREEKLTLSDGEILDWFNPNLNTHQKKAVANVLKGEFLNPYLIHGPPGIDIYSLSTRFRLHLNLSRLFF